MLCKKSEKMSVIKKIFMTKFIIRIRHVKSSLKIYFSDIFDDPDFGLQYLQKTAPVNRWG